jgi:hypothetical protein
LSPFRNFWLWRSIVRIARFQIKAETTSFVVTYGLLRRIEGFLRSICSKDSAVKE